MDPAAQSLYADLSWLPRPPSDFNAQCKSVAEARDDLGRRIRALASFALDENQLTRLAKIIAKSAGADETLKPLLPFRLGVLSNSTLDFIVPVLVGTAARHGIALQCITADYDQVIQEALSPTSTINSAKPDAVLVAIDYRALPLRSVVANAEESEKTVRAALSYIETIRAGLKTNGIGICIFQTIAPPPERLFGSFDRLLPGTLRNLIERVNAGLAQAIYGTEDTLLDVAGIAETVGLDAWHSPVQWNFAKLPFSHTYLPLYADHVSRLLAALRGK